jgi:ribose transport system permease protein
MSPRTRASIEFVLDNLVWFMLLFVLIVFSIFVPNYFQLGIFANIIEASSVLGVLSIGLSLVIIAGHMDLSVESVAALAAMAVGILFCSAGIGIGIQLQPAWLAVPASLLVAIIVGGAIGLLNGFLVVKLKMNAFIITLASYIWVRGPRRRHIGWPLRTGSRACHTLVRHPAGAWPASYRLVCDQLFCGVCVPDGENALWAAPEDDWRQ